jgi:hypothetical protein
MKLARTDLATFFLVTLNDLDFFQNANFSMKEASFVKRTLTKVA